MDTTSRTLPWPDRFPTPGCTTCATCTRRHCSSPESPCTWSPPGSGTPTPPCHCGSTRTCCASTRQALEMSSPRPWTLLLANPLASRVARGDQASVCAGQNGGPGRGRTADLPLFRRTLVPTELPDRSWRWRQQKAPYADQAVLTGFEPATSTLTGWRALRAALQDHAVLAAASCTPNGIRTRAAALKGRCPRPLDDGGSTVTAALPVAPAVGDRPSIGDGRHCRQSARAFPIIPGSSTIGKSRAHSSPAGSRTGPGQLAQNPRMASARPRPGHATRSPARISELPARAQRHMHELTADKREHHIGEDQPGSGVAGDTHRVGRAGDAVEVGDRPYRAGPGAGRQPWADHAPEGGQRRRSIRSPSARVAEHHEDQDGQSDADRARDDHQEPGKRSGREDDQRAE